MLTTSVGRGVRAIFAHAKTAVLLWLVNVALALVALLPIWWWWSRTFVLPETDPLLQSFQVGIFRDLMIDGGGLGVLTIVLIVAGLALDRASGQRLPRGRDARSDDHRRRHAVRAAILPRRRAISSGGFCG